MNKTGIPMPKISLSINEKLRKILSKTVIILILATFWFIFLIRGIFFKAEFTIKNVKRSEQTLQTYEDIDLFNIITREVKGNNYYMLKNFKKWDILDLVKESYPFVKSMDFQIETGNTLGINLNFIDPLFKIKLGEQEFWIWWEELFFAIQSGMNLGMESFTIDTPQYLTGTATLSGFFHQISLKDFSNIVPIIQENITNMNRFVYLAGSTRLAIFTNNEQVLYFNFQWPESLNEQLQKYHNLQQYYENFNKLASIDLWSLDETRVIVRKK